MNCPSNSIVQRWALAILVFTVLIVLDYSHRTPSVEPARAVQVDIPQAQEDSALKRLDQGHIPMPQGVPAAHAANLLAMPQGHPWTVLAFWFAGSKEAAPDVRIVAAYFDRSAKQWSSARIVLDRQTLSQQLGYGVSRLGNPVAWRDRQGRIHLFVVATGLGGWAASRIVHLRQDGPSLDLRDMRFKLQRTLPLSWLWNYSYLVRATPQPLQDGGMVLPVYFELGKLVPVALRFDAQGGFRGMVRLSGQTHLLQPHIVALSDVHWVALMRNSSASRKVAATQTFDGGAHWQDMPELGVDNPDSSLAAIKLSNNMMLMAHNTSAHSRSVLDLSASKNAVDWLVTAHLAKQENNEFSYPSMVWADNMLWVTYTDQRRSIAWQRFAVIPSQP